MSSPKSKVKPKTPKAVQINTILPIELQKKVVIRYGISAGLNLLKRAKLNKTKDVLAAERKISAEVNEIINKVLKGEMKREEGVKRIKELKQELDRLKSEYQKLAAPYNAKIKPLRNSLKLLDEEITSALKNLGLLVVYADPSSLPPEAKPASPAPSPTPNK